MNDTNKSVKEWEEFRDSVFFPVSPIGKIRNKEEFYGKQLFKFFLERFNPKSTSIDKEVLVKKLQEYRECLRRDQPLAGKDLDERFMLSVFIDNLIKELGL